MAGKTTRFLLTVPNDLAQQTEELKRTVFYNKPYAEMYRRLIQLGIEQLSENKEHESYVIHCNPMSK